MASQKMTLSSSPALLDATLKEGENLLVTTPHGIKLFAEVSQNKILSFKALNKSGAPVKVHMMRHNESGSGERSIKCWVCVSTPGGEFCYSIDCRKLPPPS